MMLMSYTRVKVQGSQARRTGLYLETLEVYAL